VASRSLDDLKPEARALIEPFLADWAAQADGYEALVTCTLRGIAEQDALWAQGRTTPGRIVTNAMGGQSAHNYGYAVDLVPVFHGKAIWDTEHPIWLELGDFGQARGLQWYGAPGAVFREYPHFQLPGWRELAAHGE